MRAAQDVAARRVLVAAHIERVTQYEAAMTAARKSEPVRAACDRFQKASALYRTATQLDDDVIAQLEAQISQLQDRICEIKNSPSNQKASVAMRAAEAAMHATRATALAQVRAQFPDMQNESLWDSERWAPPQEVQDAMEAARQKIAAQAGVG